MKQYLYELKSLDKQSKKNILIFLFLVVFLFSGVFFKISIIKSNALKGVATLQHEYEKYGFPVFASKITLGQVDFFSTISLERSNGDFVANIDRSIHQKIHVGTLVILQQDKNTFVRGRVSFISNHVDLDSGGYVAIIQFNNPIKLRNSFESALISVDKKVTIAVDNDNIGNDKDGNFVWTINNNLFHKQYIKVGLEDGFKSEVLSGLHPGDIIVTSDLKHLKESMRARIVDNIK